MKIDCNISYKKVGHVSRDEICRMAQDKGYKLAGNWKSCLRYAASKIKQRTSDGDQKVTMNLGKRIFGDATVIKNRRLKSNRW